MATKKRGLSTGLDVLLADASTDTDKNAEAQGIEIKLSMLRPGKFQPRKSMDQTELATLAESIKAQGLLQPIVVRPLSAVPGQYEILAGERRWRAAKLAGLSKVPVVIKPVADEAAMIIGLVENIQRSELNPLEEALAFENMVKTFGLTHAEVAKAVGRSRTAVTNTMRLLALRPEVKKLLEQGYIEAGHAKVLLALQGASQLQIAQRVAEKNLSVRETEQAVLQLLTKNKANQAKGSAVTAGSPDIVALERKLAETLGASVKIQHLAKGKGKLVINYSSLAELDGILAHIR